MLAISLWGAASGFVSDGPKPYSGAEGRLRGLHTWVICFVCVCVCMGLLCLPLALKEGTGLHVYHLAFKCCTSSVPMRCTMRLPFMPAGLAG
jgi:hypothetical protein